MGNCFQVPKDTAVKKTQIDPIIANAITRRDAYHLSDARDEQISSNVDFLTFASDLHLSLLHQHQWKCKINMMMIEESKSIKECVQFARSELDSLPPIRVLDFDLYETLNEIPRCGFGKCSRFPDAPSTDYTVPLNSIDRENAVVIFVSHCWIAGFDGRDGDGNVIDEFIVKNWRGYPHPDTKENDKFKLEKEAIKSVWKNLAPGMQKCYIWHDFSCMDQNGNPAGELKQLDKIVEACDCILTPVVDLKHEEWEYPSAWAETFTQYAASGFSLNGGKFSYTNRPWCRVEMLYAANIPLSAENGNRLDRFAHGLKTAQGNNMRPHLLYGTKELATNRSPLQLPPLANSHLKTLSPDVVMENLTCLDDAKKVVELMTELGPYIKKVQEGYAGERNAAGKKHGKGVLTYGNGDKYDGEYKDGKRHGKGVFTWANGDKYDGEWVDGKQHGKGVFTYASGDKYDGEYKDGKKHGKGLFTSADGAKYDGEWVDGNRHGKGVYTWADGRSYQSEWKDGERVGDENWL